MKTYRAVIVGLRGIGAGRPKESPHRPLYGARPGSHASAYHRHPQTELVAVCDINGEALDRFKETWHDVWPQMRYYTDYREMLEKESPDLVSVATSDHLHADITIDAASSGARAILCEKPIATTLADADRMIAAAEAEDVLLSIEHTRRWTSSHHAVRDLIREGELGPLRGITANMYGPRSMLFRNGTHMVDTICFFAESEPQWVFAELEEGFDHFTEYSSDGRRDPSLDPAASAYIHFSNGVRAFYNSLKVAMLGSQTELHCDDGRVEISERGATVIRGTSHAAWSSATLVPDHYMYERQLGAVAELVHVLEHGGLLVSPAREARKTLQIILAMLKSHKRGNVRVDLS